MEKVRFQACSFLLGHPEELDYNKLYDACVSLLVAGTKVDKAVKGTISLLVILSFTCKNFCFSSVGVGEKSTS